MVVGDRDRRSNRRVAAVRHFIAVVDGVANRRIRTARGNRLDQRQSRRLRRRRRRRGLIRGHRAQFRRGQVDHRTRIQIGLRDGISARACGGCARSQATAGRLRAGHCTDLVVGNRQCAGQGHVADVLDRVGIADRVANRRIRAAGSDGFGQLQRRALVGDEHQSLWIVDIATSTRGEAELYLCCVVGQLRLGTAAAGVRNIDHFQVDAEVVRIVRIARGDVGSQIGDAAVPEIVVGAQGIGQRTGIDHIPGGRIQQTELVAYEGVVTFPHQCAHMCGKCTAGRCKQPGYGDICRGIGGVDDHVGGVVNRQAPVRQR